MEPRSKQGSKKDQRWIVKEAEGKIWGPYTTEQVLAQIERGYYVGGEQVAAFPGGTWVAISKSPEFYDRLLDVLASEGRNAKAAAEMQETVALPPEEPTDKIELIPVPSDVADSQVTALNRTHGVAEVGEYTDKLTSPNLPAQTSNSPANTSLTNQTVRGPVIELTDLKTLEEKEEGSKSKLPFFLILAALALVVAALLVTDDEKKPVEGNRIHLLSPRKGAAAMDEATARTKVSRAMSAFNMDTFSGYQRAQNELVEVAQAPLMNPEAAQAKGERLAALCLTYRELWPYSFQDSQDLKTVNDVMQESKRLDPGGKSGATCEIVQLILSGRFNDAQGLTESMLVEDSQTPVLFEIRGDIYSYTRDYKTAATYFNQASTLWPGWQKIVVQEARAYRDLKQYPQAMNLYRQVINKVPTHAVAKIELGLIEGLQFQHFDDSLGLLTTALDGKEKVPGPVEEAGSWGVAVIQEKRGQTKKALEFAKRTLALNPSNMNAKAMIERLGGQVNSGDVSTDQGQLSYLAEQDVRDGDYFAAQAKFKAAYEANPKNGVPAMRAGFCLWQLNQSADAIEWTKKAVTSDPKLTSAYVQLANYYGLRYDYASAMQVLTKIQRLQPKSYEVYRGFAAIELQRNNWDGSINFANRALKLYETDLETYLIMSKAQLGKGQAEEAQRYASRAIELDFNNTEAHTLYGKSEARLRGIESGVQYMQGLINRFIITKGQQVPQAAIEYRIALAEIYLQDERYQAAQEVLNQALALDSDNKRALVNLGKALQAQNFRPQALETLLRAAVLDPSDAEPIYLAGMLYADTGKIQEATQQFERVLKINPRYPRAHVALGQMALRQGDSKRALEEAMKERETNPNLGDSFLLAAESYYALKQYSNCAGEYQQASRQQRSASIMVRMARCYRLAGALDSAQSLLRQAQSLESGNPELYKEQGAIFHMKGMADEAVAAYDTYLKLVPAATDRAEIENRMRKVRTGDLNVGE
jgi:tetratricopeptide (TPR) repeat protein